MCQIVDEFTDMDAEFAPEPIVVACRDRATHVAQFLDLLTGGEPEWVTERVCDRHADAFRRMMDDPEPHPWMRNMSLVPL